MEIDRKRIAAMRTLEVLGYSYCNGEWLAPAAAAGTPPPMAADAGKFTQRMDALAGCIEGSAEAGELKAIVDLIEACEVLWGRWTGTCRKVRVSGRRGRRPLDSRPVAASI